MVSMEQKMGKAQGPTSRQKQLLELVLQTDEIFKNFYLSGGTALSGWYLRHREFYGLDFFSDRPFDEKAMYRFYERLAGTLKSKIFKFDLLALTLIYTTYILCIHAR